MKYWLLTIFAMLLACQQADVPLPTEGGGEDGVAAESADTLVAATAEAHADDEPIATPIADVEPSIGVNQQDFAYGSTADRNLVGYFVTPEDVFEPLPGVILIHEWWGLNENIKSMARRIAGEGYAVLAVDLYGGAVAANPNEAETLMAAVMDEPQATLANIEQAIDFLNQFALAPTIGTLGWCLGGGWSLQAGLEMADRVDAVVMYYGQVATDHDRLRLLKAPLLGIFAELDEVVPLQEVQSFRSKLQELGNASEVFIYSGVAHAFANPSGGAYDATAADEAWNKTIEFLNENLKPGAD